MQKKNSSFLDQVLLVDARVCYLYGTSVGLLGNNFSSLVFHNPPSHNQSLLFGASVVSIGLFCDWLSRKKFQKIENRILTVLPVLSIEILWMLCSIKVLNGTVLLSDFGKLFVFSGAFAVGGFFLAEAYGLYLEVKERRRK